MLMLRMLRANVPDAIDVTPEFWPSQAVIHILEGCASPTRIIMSVIHDLEFVWSR